MTKIKITVYEKLLPDERPNLSNGRVTYKVVNNEVYRVSYV